MIGLASASAILLLISLVGIGSNLIALLTVKRTKYMHNTFGALCVSLASCNLGICLIFFGWCSVATLSMLDSADHRVFFDSELGKKVGQVTLFFLYGSMYTHLAVSFNRMMSVMFPLRLFFDFLISIVVVFFILAMDVIALLKLRASHKGAYISAMTTEQRKARKIEFVFFVQSLCQTVPFLIAALCFHVVSRYAETDWQLFWATTFSWVSLHTIDGLIIDIFHTRRSVFTWKMKIIPSISVSSSSQGIRTKTMESRL